MADDSTHVFPGHLGHLLPSQQEALTTFKANLAEALLYIPPTDAREASHDEPTLLYGQCLYGCIFVNVETTSRFLRARGFNPAAAQKQFSDAESWRKRHDVHNLYVTFDADEFETSKRFYPRWTGRRDKVCACTQHLVLVVTFHLPQNGLPLYVYRIASLIPIQKELDLVPPERRYQRMCVLQYFAFT